jgi:hypothetical protein
MRRMDYCEHGALLTEGCDECGLAPSIRATAIPTTTEPSVGKLTALRRLVEYIRNNGAYTTALKEIEALELRLAEPTVESALKELREMFPDKGHEWQFISIRKQEFIDTYMPHVARRRVEIHVGNGQSPPSCEAATLDQAMAQVRAWHREQSKSQQ